MTQPSALLSWGILGTGRIAKTFAGQLQHASTGRLAAVGSRSRAGADAFASAFPGITAHGSYEALLCDPAVEAVYIATPHAEHARWAIEAARHGKHLLVEKPLALNHAEAMAVAQAAREHGVFLMEAFMYRTHPQMERVAEIVRSGVLGKLTLLRANFAFGPAAYRPESRLWQQALGGGAILDVGCYPMSFARWIAGLTLGRPFAEPVELTALGTLHEPSGVDEQALATLRFEGDLLAELSTAINSRQDRSATLFGTKGSLFIPNPWLPGEEATLELRVGEETQTLAVSEPRPLYALEADAVAAHLAAGESPRMPVDDTLGNQLALDRWRKAIGLIYENEKEGASTRPLPPLRKAPAAIPPNLYRSVPGIDKPLSRMVLGTDLVNAVIAQPHAFALFDSYLEHGGNTFDTSYHYGSGLGERLLGHWMAQRGVREKVVVIAKGAHTPNCNPKAMREQFEISLERMQIDHAEFYLLHRDNPEVPVGEFVDALNELVDEGRITLFGGSNWSLERVAEANAYAKAHGRQGFGAVSNQFSLAAMNDPIWAGCISASDAASRQWLTEAQMPFFAWSSQARGFFVRGSRSMTGDAELNRCWYSDDNFRRLERVRQLAREKKTTPILIAAAYVLHQPFPMFALIGPQKLSELAASFQAFGVGLTPEEMAWLNLESDHPRA
ncbi:MAG TPA: aldo/keto reductase [Chthoniobacteraceae bacterium]|nr:aldo/keto reductase [Chthoniobacteraceae bacterium]